MSAKKAKEKKPKFLTPGDVIKRWRGCQSIRTLNNWKFTGKGPPFFKIGGKTLYREDSLEKWEFENFKECERK